VFGWMAMATLVQQSFPVQWQTLARS
jgi:hypothetical protein